MRKFARNAAALVVAGMALGFLVHGVLLHADYSRLPHLFRSEKDSQAYFHFMIAAHALIALALVWLYRKGKEDKPWLGQGLRFGAAAALLAPVPTYLMYYAVMPMPGTLVAKQVILDGLAWVGFGALLAWLES